MKFKNTYLRILLVSHLFLFGISEFNIININSDTTQLSWHLQQINVEEAWAITKGSSNITVAILDTGIDFVHSELNHSAWINANEIPNNSIDDDLNGYIDDINGWDWVSNDNHPEYEEEDPIHYHGTFIAGIIAGKDDNNGIVGIAPDVRLMALKVVDTDLLIPNPSGLAEAVQYAINEGADVISMSLDLLIGPPGFHSSLENAITADIPLVASVGNTYVSEGGGRDSITIPAVFSEVIAVGATNFYQERADYSNFGEELEIVAPVGDEQFDTEEHIIRSISTENSFRYSYGTSYAAPQVSAVIALIKSIRADLNVNDIRFILQNSATDISTPGWDRFTGYGLLNASAAVRMAQVYEKISNQSSSKHSPWIFFTSFPETITLVSLIIVTLLMRIVTIKRKA
jgi:subtilisin family serine protease